MSIRKSVLEKIGSGALRQALNSHDFTNEEIEYIIYKVEK